MLCSLATYLLTPWCRVLLEKLTGLQLVKKFPAFYGTRRFITALTSVRHLSLSWASPIQSIYPHPTSWRSVLILSTHLRLGLPSGLFTYSFPTKTLYSPLYSPIRATCAILILILINSTKVYKIIFQKVLCACQLYWRNLSECIGWSYSYYVSSPAFDRTCFQDSGLKRSFETCILVVQVTVAYPKRL